MPRLEFRPLLTVLACGSCVSLAGCFVYTEELLDNDAVSLGAGASSGTPVQPKLQALNQRQPLAEESRAIDAGHGDAANDAASEQE